MTEKQVLLPENLPRIQSALAKIGEEDESLLVPPTAIARDTSTGRISVLADSETEPLAARQILDELAAQTDFLGQSPEVVTANTRLAARLGALALEQVYAQTERYSEAQLRQLHDSLRSVHKKIVQAVIFSKDLRRDPKALADLKRFVDPNPRLAKYYEKQDLKEKGILE